MVEVRITWNLWGRSMALCACWCLWWGAWAFIWAYPKQWPALAVYSWVFSMLITVLLWPIEKLGIVRIVVQNYFVNGVLFVGLGIYPCIEIPSLCGGICLILSGLMYIAAGITGEKGLSLEELAAK
eukprot:TRINITY_DN5482_c0_g1_i1.p1 TRINITY_DN5482_c0_g1~~TRINITY_DN5482_c0_g1_i1.p1  ORF type:complete len:126 (+),score=18.97 TRINITY_DN5482_c0_g1_i1:36-413(+)